MEEKVIVPFLLLAFLLSVIFFVRFLFITATVISQSMLPTLEIDDRVLALRHWPVRWLHKGQIVLFWEATGKDGYRRNIPLIKRIVGLPGDTLVDIQTTENDFQEKKQVVPPENIAVKGDLLDEVTSLSVGFVPQDNFIALVVMKLPYRDRRARKIAKNN